MFLENFVEQLESIIKGGSIPLPNFGFVFTEMPSWSVKPTSGTVFYYDKILYNDECIDGVRRVLYSHTLYRISFIIYK